MKSHYWLLAGVLLAGGAMAVPQYGPMPGPGPGPGMGGAPGPYMGAPARGPQMSNPARALRAGIDRLLAYLGAEPRPTSEALAGFLDQEIAPFFDFEYMTKSAGGRLYEDLDEGQRQAMVQDIKASFLTKMAEKLGAYDNQQVRFLPPRGGDDGRTAQVSVAILNPGSYPARLDFRLYRTGDQWLVYDVAANGRSAIVHYRNQLMRQVQERRMRQMRQAAVPAGPMGPIGPRGPMGGPGMRPPGMGYGPGPGPAPLR
jgi:phospholipid transport system substrate-binding protein